MYSYLYVYVFVHIHIPIYMYIYIDVYLYIHIFIYTHIYLHLSHVYTHIYIHCRKSIHVFIYFMYVHIYIYIVKSLHFTCITQSMREGFHVLIVFLQQFMARFSILRASCVILRSWFLRSFHVAWQISPCDKSGLRDKFFWWSPLLFRL